MSYCTREDIDREYGRTNVDKWADLENTESGDDIDDRVDWAIALGDVEIDDRLRDGPYAIPFTSPPRRIVRLCAIWAGLMLYQSRGSTDFDADGNAQDQYQHQRRYFDESLKKIHGGLYKFEDDDRPAVFPQVVTDED